MMSVQTIDVSRYKKDNSFYGEVDLLVAIKSFDLQAIRSRYLKSRENTKGKIGSVERRKVTTGGIVSLRIKKGQLLAEKELARLKEPRGICAGEDMLIIGAENKVYAFTDEEVQTITNPWFSYIHSVNLSSDKKKLVVSSSGFDVFFEYDMATFGKIYEWLAWENGFNKGKDPKSGKTIILSKENLKSAEADVLVISDPKTQVLPTAMRAAFINSVDYDSKDENQFIATFFHEGAVYHIDKQTNNAQKVLEGLKMPHGGRRFNNQFMVTSTGSGEVVTGDVDMQTNYSFKNLPGKPDYLSELEWLQNTIVYQNCFITIDSNRTSFVIFDPQKQLIDVIAYDENWAVQEIFAAKISEEKTELLQGISEIR
ncbi:MAG: hypothetical protein COA57_16610 [Flavobacteriales bacterium]|nr:MAG: hypothetical protein COA57_16610 [Flavobacteriales bacterium]